MSRRMFVESKHDPKKEEDKAACNDDNSETKPYLITGGVDQLAHGLSF